MEPARKKPVNEPTFVGGLIGSAIPLAFAVAVISIGGFLVYLFWFGTDWITNWLFR
jgi:hypothetical protein